jgi:SAM-dependent methyltransferase
VSLLVPPRRPSREFLDDPRISSDEMLRSLRDLALVNRRWGGSRALERHLTERARQSGSRRVSVLDVGAGAGDVCRRLARALRRTGIEATAVALDLQWRHIAAGHRMNPGDRLPCVAADAFRLPFAARSFDWVVSTLFCHHFSPEENIPLLRELARVARSGFALLDLRRHVFPLVFVSLAGRAVFESRISVADGAASVRQAYTIDEARAFATKAVPGARAVPVFPFRLLICGPGG